MVNPDSSMIDPTFPLKGEVKVVKSTSSPPDPSLPIESENHLAEVFIVSYDCSMQEEFLSLSIEPSLSSEVISFDWSNLTESCLHLSVSFQIVVNVTARRILHTIVDEGASVSIISSTAWKDLGSPQLVSATDQILDFNRRPTAPLGILPHLPITLGGKIVCIGVMVVQGPLDFNLLLGHDYVYGMKAVVSTLLRVMHFPHDGKIVTIDQLFYLHLTIM